MELDYTCVCCGFRTMPEPPGSHQICAVCRWEDDVLQLRRPYLSGGANKTSLIEAQKTAPRKAEFDRDPFWRPIDAGRDRFEPPSSRLARWPDDYTVLYWWRRRPGTAWWDLDRPDAAFAEAVRAVAAVAPPADPEDLDGMAIDFDHYLWRCPSIREVTVSSGPDPYRRLTARCLAVAEASPDRVAREITQAWLRDLRYRFWEAHFLWKTPAAVTLDVATRIDADGYFITGRIVAEWTDR